MKRKVTLGSHVYSGAEVSTKLKAERLYNKAEYWKASGPATILID